jgi:hypothetical protein
MSICLLRFTFSLVLVFLFAYYNGPQSSMIVFFPQIPLVIPVCVFCARFKNSFSAVVPTQEKWLSSITLLPLFSLLDAWRNVVATLVSNTIA